MPDPTSRRSRDRRQPVLVSSILRKADDAMEADARSRPVHAQAAVRV
ncbi:hypothetical protein NY08_1433 [Rhodococcus sp. B7740]|nr:hypothetical protein NY08_1433 [Rhodococcus sp. B7740]